MYRSFDLRGSVAQRKVRAVALVLGIMGAVIWPAASADGASLKGAVKSGKKPIRGAPVTLFRATAKRPVVLGRARTTRKGRFTIHYRRPRSKNGPLRC